MKLKVRHTKEFITVKWDIQNRSKFRAMLDGSCDNVFLCIVETQMGMGWGSTNEAGRTIRFLLVELQERIQNELRAT